MFRQSALLANSTAKRAVWGPSLSAFSLKRWISVPAPPVLPAAVAAKFEIVKQQPIPELAVFATRYRHKATRADIISLRSEDDNKVFGVAFRTAPSDSTGVAHILEHSVLCGSRKYPVKEPFVELLKSSLQNFLNAMTYPDRTVYPVATQNLADFYNLVDVYMDAVFHPRLEREVFLQEGWHHELSPAKDRITYKGVVFNEMKGVYSSPDSVNHTWMQASLFPDTAYSHSSGGDPAAIPNLTYTDFVSFHRKNYHPSNSMVFFYGDDDEGKRLDIVDSYFAEYSRSGKGDEVTWQKPLASPVFVKKPYPGVPSLSDDQSDAEEGGKSESKHFLTVGWVLNHAPGELGDVDRLAWTTLNVLLTGTDTAPLKKALVESGLGEALSGYGFEDDLLQATYSVGLKGISNKDDVGKVEPIVLRVLSELAESGFTEDHLAAALNTIEFHLREFATDADTPKGLTLMLSATPSWLYNRDPLHDMAYEDVLAAFKKRLASEPHYLQSLIRRHLLGNHHKVTLHLYPDTTLKEQLDTAETEKLASHWQSLKAKDVEELAKENEALLARQEAVDSPENLARIPSLKLSDLSSTPKTIPRVLEHYGVGSRERPVDVLLHDQPCNGIGYFRLLFDVKHVVPEHMLPLIPLYSRCLTHLGTTLCDETTMSHRIGTHTGGISAFGEVIEYPGNVHDVVATVTVTGKATKDKLPRLFELMDELLKSPQFDSKAMVSSFVRETVASMEAAFLSSGLNFAMIHMSSSLSMAKWIGEKYYGYSQLQFARALLHRIETDWPAVVADLQELHNIVTTANTTVSLTGDESTLAAFESSLRPFLRGFPDAKQALSPWTWAPFDLKPTAFVIPSQVNYVAQLGLGYPDLHAPGSADVISSFLRMSYLWERVRVQGGAYGAGVSVNRMNGSLGYYSYRDPNLASTLSVFNGTSDFLTSTAMTPDDIRKAVISTIGAVDAPMSPDTKGVVSTTRYLVGITDADVQQRRNEILNTNADDVKAFAAAARRVQNDGKIAVLGSIEAVEKSGLEFVVIDPLSMVEG